MPRAIPQIMQHANDEIRLLLGELEHSDGHGSVLRVLCRRASSLQQVLEQSGCVLTRQTMTDAESGGSVSEYVGNLNCLRTCLENAGRQLLTYKMELDSERSRLQTLTRWAATAQATEPSHRR